MSLFFTFAPLLRLSCVGSALNSRSSYFATDPSEALRKALQDPLETKHLRDSLRRGVSSALALSGPAEADAPRLPRCAAGTRADKGGAGALRARALRARALRARPPPRTPAAVSIQSIP